MRIEVEPGIAVSAKTVGELRNLTSWPENAVISVPQEHYPESVTKVSKASSQRGTRTSIEKINRESIDGTCVGWQARWTVSLPAIVNNREKTMRL